MTEAHPPIVRREDLEDLLRQKEISTKQEVLRLIKAVMPNRNFIYNTPEEVVKEIWENIDELERNHDQ